MYKAFVAAFMPILAVSSTISSFRHTIQPSFETMSTSVETPAGTIVRLQCPVRHLGTKTVVWFKGNDILTIGGLVWVNDARLSVSTNSTFPLTTQTLIITDVRPGDSGFYHCEVTSRPSLRSPSIELVVGDPVPSRAPLPVQMTGSRFVEMNSPITLVCQMPFGVDGPLDWFKDGNIVVTTDNSDTLVNQFVHPSNNTGAGSTLMIRQARMSDSGTYICRGVLDNVPLLGSTRVNVLVADVHNIRRGSV